MFQAARAEGYCQHVRVSIAWAWLAGCDAVLQSIMPALRAAFRAIHLAAWHSPTSNRRVSTPHTCKSLIFGVFVFCPFPIHDSTVAACTHNSLLSVMYLIQRMHA